MVASATPSAGRWQRRKHAWAAGGCASKGSAPIWTELRGAGAWRRAHNPGPANSCAASFSVRLQPPTTKLVLTWEQVPIVAGPLGEGATAAVQPGLFEVRSPGGLSAGVGPMQNHHAGCRVGAGRGGRAASVHGSEPGAARGVGLAADAHAGWQAGAAAHSSARVGEVKRRAGEAGRQAGRQGRAEGNLRRWQS